MTVTSHYDVVIVGGTLSAAVCAALLAKRRYRGLLVDQGELASASHPLLLDLVPSERGSMVVKHVHDELSLSERFSRYAAGVSPLLQVIYPDRRLDIGDRRVDVINEVARASGLHDATTIRAALDRLDAVDVSAETFLMDAPPLPAEGFFDRRAATAAARKHPDAIASADTQGLLDGISSELRALLIGLLPFLTHVDARTADDMPACRLARPLSRFLGGVVQPEDGQSLRSVLIEHAERGGFEVIRGVADHIKPNGKQLEIGIAEERRALSADMVVDASGDLSGLETLPIKQRGKQLAGILEVSRPKGHLHALRIEIDRAVLPEPMAPRVLLLNGRGQVRAPGGNEPEDRPILLQVREAEQAGRAHLIALHPVSEIESHLGHDSLDEAIRARLVRLIPFLQDGHPAPSRIPIAAHPLFDAELDPIAGIGGIPTATPMKNVVVAGPAVLPGLGAEGAYLAALQVADHLDRTLRHEKKPRPLAKRLIG